MEFEFPSLRLQFGSGAEASEEGRRTQVSSRVDHSSIPDFTEVTKAFPDFAGAVSVFAAGSVILGWGHATSDLDLYVITEDRISISEGLEAFDRHVSTADPLIHIVIGELGPYRADIEVWRASQVDEIIGRFADRTPDQEAPDLDRTEQDMIYRLASGRPLHGEDWWARRRKAIDESNYGLWLAERRKLFAESFLEDVAGLLAAEDAETALLAAHEAFALSVEAVLAVHGDYTINRKWLYRRLQTVRPPEIGVDDAWKMITMVGASADPAGWAANVARTAQVLLLAVEARSA
jgi:hypothetical protein